MTNLIKTLALTTDTLRIATERNQRAIAATAYTSLLELVGKLDGATNGYLSANATGASNADAQGTIPHVTTQGHDLILVVKGTDYENATGLVRFVILAEENLNDSNVSDFALVDLQEKTVTTTRIGGGLITRPSSVDLVDWVAAMEA